MGGEEDAEQGCYTFRFGLTINPLGAAVRPITVEPSRCRSLWPLSCYCHDLSYFLHWGHVCSAYAACCLVRRRAVALRLLAAATLASAWMHC